MKPESMDAVFGALAHRDRRAILDAVKSSPGITVGEVCELFDSHRVVILKHMNVLEQAGLLIRQKEGRLRRLYVNAVPIRMISDRWLTAYSSLWAGQMTGLKYRVESAGGGDDDG
jgi:DNA-binding transcriptional ArsR family regulator